MPKKPERGEKLLYGTENTVREAGGETHQIAGPDVPTLTTQQGTPVSDDQNS